jgi:hypothetical protein
MGSPILVWPYSEAPDEMRIIADKLFEADDEDGQDEQCDWIALIPAELESFKKGFLVDWDGEIPSDGSRVRSCEAIDEHGGYILAGKFIEKTNDQERDQETGEGTNFGGFD